uniref:G-protein coupled receptors family 1 profile domain-containing protein n=1 Tax=Gasterosteus aculeatus TaxID=69293 RepID=G3NQV4_GASAC
FFLALLCYIVIMLANGVVLCIIVIDKNLHRPMYILVCNLVVCDLLGATTVLPRLMMHFLMGQKKIGYISAIAQAFCVHLYGTAVQTILGVMAYDRYIAVCEPLRYHAIMTSARLHSYLALAWFIAVLLIAVLFILHMNSPLCVMTLIVNPYCDNASLFKLSCESVLINNIYGLTFILVLLRSSIGCMVLTYTKITVLSSNNKSSNSKAFKTLSTHLVTYLIVVFSGIFKC